MGTDAVAAAPTNMSTDTPAQSPTVPRGDNPTRPDDARVAAGGASGADSTSPRPGRTWPDAPDDLVRRLVFDDQGLIPAVVQDHRSRDVLMVAWMDATAVEATLTEGRTVFWSRSRQELWRKGATSGHVQMVRDLRIDCDGDTLLVSVDQHGAACHTGERTCFHQTVDEMVSAEAGSSAAEVRS